MEKTIIFTDGACSGNPGPGGWASVIVFPNGQVRELGGPAVQTTNNRMEILGVLEALRFIASHPPSKGKPAREAVKPSISNAESSANEVVVYTDSVYVLKGVQQWMWGWSRNNWKTSEGKEVLNQDLWKEFIEFFKNYDRKKIKWNYCAGHSGVPGNERCDEVAVAFSKGERPYLFSGQLGDYSVDIMNLPESRDLPEFKPKSEKKKVLCYLSYVNGVLTRHGDWASCEKAVKGRPGAKFKKAHSESEEKEILLSWGIKN